MDNTRFWANVGLLSLAAFAVSPLVHGWVDGLLVVAAFVLIDTRAGL